MANAPTAKARSVIVDGQQIRVAVRPGRAATATGALMVPAKPSALVQAMVMPPQRQMNLLIPKSRLHVYHGGHLGLATEAADLAPVVDASSPHRYPEVMPRTGRGR